MKVMIDGRASTLRGRDFSDTEQPKHGKMQRQPHLDDLESAQATAALDSFANEREADDLNAVERLLASLDRELPDPFVFPNRPSSDQRVEGGANSSALQAWAVQPLPSVPAAEGRGNFLAWLFLAAGLMAFACGAVMLAWSIAANRDELWSLGIPLALGGQGAIVFGLLGLVEAAAQRHKSVAAALEEHRQRLTMMQNLALVTQATPAASRRAA